MSNINSIDKIRMCCICSAIFLWTLAGQAETPPANKKPVLTSASIEEMGNTLGSSGFLTLIIKEAYGPLDGLRIKEQYIDGNGAIRTLEEDYPVWIDPRYGGPIPRHGIQMYSIDVDLRESKDEEL